MKTTLELPESLFQKLKQAAAARGTSPEKLIVTALENNFPSAIAPSASQAATRVQLPLIESKRPGTLLLTNADIEELLA